MKNILRKRDINATISKLQISLTFEVILIYTLLFSFVTIAQPSGGPYGPIRQNYSIPKTSGKIYYVSPDGKAEDTGENISKPTTIESAIEKVKTGDVIIMRGGIYRTGNLILNQQITIQPYADEQPVLKGTFIATEWKNLGNGLWKTTWTRLFPAKPDNWWSRDRFGKETPLHKFNNDMVFADGKFLQSVSCEAEVNENTYYIDYDTKQVYIGIDPTNHTIEITAYDLALKRTTEKCHGKTSDGKGPIIKGITFTQYAYRAIDIEGTDPEGISKETEHGKQVVGTTLENCTITFCSRVAAYIKGDKLTIRNCKVSDTSTEGLYIIASNDVLLEKNIFSRNNIEQITGYYPAAVKIFNQCYRVTCNDNLVIDHPYSNGIWYDVGNVDGIFINNWVQDVGNINRHFTGKRPWPSDNGFFFEISKGAICAGNVFVNCDQGIFVLNSSNVFICQNTLINSTVCISRNGRTPENDATFGWHSGTGPNVEMREGHVFVNNLLVGNENYKRPFLYVWQPENLCDRLKKPQLKQIDGNVYVNLSTNKQPIILWSPADNKECTVNINTPKDLNALYPNFSKNCQYYDENIPLFKSCVLLNFELLPSFPALKNAIELPKEVKKLLNISKKYIGAYPPMQ